MLFTLIPLVRTQRPSYREQNFSEQDLREQDLREQD